MTQMDWLEKLKKSDSSNEAITTELVGQSHMEQRGLGMFAVADRLDRQGEYGKNIVKVMISSAIPFLDFNSDLFHFCNVNGVAQSFWRNGRGNDYKNKICKISCHSYPLKDDERLG